jgi:ADP-ribosyl-[dinitrogen reductase] hydrolase
MKRVSGTSTAWARRSWRSPRVLFKKKDPPEIKGTGYVVKSLEAALWAFDRSNSFREGALLAVNLGNDADTTGAIYGQIAGAFYGAEGIPAEWRAKLALHDFIQEKADQLFAIAEPSNPNP